MKTSTPSADPSAIKTGKTKEMKREDEKMRSEAGRRLIENPGLPEVDAKLRISTVPRTPSSGLPSSRTRRSPFLLSGTLPTSRTRSRPTAATWKSGWKRTHRPQVAGPPAMPMPCLNRSWNVSLDKQNLFPKKKVVTQSRN